MTNRMSNSHIAYLLLRTSLRHWRHSWLSYLTLVGIIALGVGAFNGIRQASRAAAANFGLFNEAVSGKSDFILQGIAGQPLSHKQLHSLVPLTHTQDWHLLPVIEGNATYVHPESSDLIPLQIIGLDLIALGNLPQFNELGLSFSSSQSTDSDKWYQWLQADSGVWVTHALSQRLQHQSGQQLPLMAGGTLQSVRIAGQLGDANSDLPDDLIIADIRTVQNFLGREQAFDRIEILLADRSLAADPKAFKVFEQRLRQQLPSGVELQAAADRLANRASMTAAFRLNLSILSLIALLVGAYLILQALDASIVRRREELATLRSLGVGAGTLFAMAMLESGLMGILGSFLGLGLGQLLASVAVHGLSDTINTLYFATAAQAIELQGSDVWIALSLGLGFSLMAGLLPARDAMLTPPAQILARGDWSPGFTWLRSARFSLSLFGLGLLCLLLPPLQIEGGAKMALGGFLAAGLWISSLALLSGQFLVLLARTMQKLASHPVWRMAMSRLADGSSRHRLALAGLVVAVGMVTGMLQLVGSFRGTIQNWFEVRFEADLYISERGAQGAGSNSGIRPEVLQAIESLPELEFADTLHMARVQAPLGVTQLIGADFAFWQHQKSHIWLQAPGRLVPASGAQPALVSESFARRFDCLQGGVIALETASGSQKITPIGIFADYGSEFGSVVIDLPIWKTWTLQDRALNTSLYLKPGLDSHLLRDRLRLQFPALDIRNNHELRAYALSIFEQTFQVTRALNVIGLFVACVGLLLGLIALFEECQMTWRTLAFIGFSRREIIWVGSLEGAGLSLVAWLSGTILGLLLGWLLLACINVQSFGWTLIWHLPAWQLLLFGLGLILMGLACGLVAALRVSKRLEV